MDSTLPSTPSPDPDPSAQTRRSFLQTVAGPAAAGVAAGVAGLGLTGAEEAPGGGAAEKAAPLLKTVRLGAHSITRLILGGNPIYGHSHFNQLYSQHLIDYHTPDRVAALLRQTVSAGINTWQNSYAPRTLEDVERCRREGIPFNWLLLGKPDWDAHPELIQEAAARRPIGIAPHGALAERLHRAGKTEVLRDLLKRIRQTGVLVGLSAHNPALIDLADEQGWDVDYYMCCLYYLTRPREELARILGEIPYGEIYLPSDRERMLKTVRAARKPCLVYKIFAAGRLDLTPEGTRRNIRETLAAIKPGDAIIAGMFQEFGDQVGMNARWVREAMAD